MDNPGAGVNGLLLYIAQYIFDIDMENSAALRNAKLLMYC
jgi:hypothetical protein